MASGHLEAEVGKGGLGHRNLCGRHNKDALAGFGKIAIAGPQLRKAMEIRAELRKSRTNTGIISVPDVVKTRKFM